ncbi:two-component system, OmpR family, sensor histidine kinase VicK [Anaerolineae bacterium]|nr:two-component system, OmpR family, sensor histidine kinase VicK [Anaerolineae bacterium]
MDKKKTKILLIEDNPGDVRLLEEMLKEAGDDQFELKHADRLSLGQECLSKGKFDVILLDLGLPESQGLPTLDKILPLASKVPIVVLTGSSADEMIGITAVKKGAQDYLTKGQLDSNLLVRAIRYAIERKRTEEILRKSEDRFRTLVQTAPTVIICLSSEGRILEFNPEAERVYGCKREEVLGQNYLNVFLPAEIRKSVAKDMKKVLKGEPTRGFENSIKSADGNVRFFLWNVDRLIDENGYPSGIVAIGQDITERKRYEEELRKQREYLEYLNSKLTAVNKELETFSYSVSHDLRAPLRRIVGFCKALMEDSEDKLDTRGKDYLRRVREASEHMGQLIEDILNLSRITLSEIHYKTFDLSALAKMIARELQEMQPERQVEFVVTEGLIAKGDPRLLQIALQNLLNNAWKFTRKRPHAKIELGTTQCNGKPAYFVRDNGVGFNMDYANKLFGPFQRLHSTTDFEGTGIGLATVQRIIHRHGGHIWVEGAVDKGATFYFTLR